MCLSQGMLCGRGHHSAASLQTNIQPLGHAIDRASSTSYLFQFNLLPDGAHAVVQEALLQLPPVPQAAIGVGAKSRLGTVVRGSWTIAALLDAALRTLPKRGTLVGTTAALVVACSDPVANLQQHPAVSLGSD
jgi:hypothetical protein